VREIVYLSPPSQVSMADRWFEIAAVDHFWILRRFEALRRLAGHLIENARDIAEVGCGHGLLQRQIEDAYAREVTGFDLNEVALKQNLSERSTICCYDVCQQSPKLNRQFDLILLFDVLEHIEDEDQFLQAVLFHLAPAGHLVINVPANQWMYSAYDRAAGHKRRYSAGTLEKVSERNDLRLELWSYWGFPLLPTLIARKYWPAGKDEASIISSGFSARNKLTNRFLGALSRCEPLPQRFLGTSLMAVLSGRPPK
jgi:SAM-dependent methyltransferase